MNYELPEPKPMMYAKTYRDKFAVPLVKKLKGVIRNILVHYFEKTNEMKKVIERTRNQVWDLTERVKKLEPENDRLRGIERDFNRVRRVLGGKRVDEVINAAQKQELVAEESGKADRKTRISLDYAL